MTVSTERAEAEAIIQIICQCGLAHLEVKCEPTVRAAAYYSDILPSGGVPVTRR